MKDKDTHLAEVHEINTEKLRRIGQSIPADTVVRIRAGEMDILQKITD